MQDGQGRAGAADSPCPPAPFWPEGKPHFSPHVQAMPRRNNTALSWFPKRCQNTNNKYWSSQFQIPADCITWVTAKHSQPKLQCLELHMQINSQTVRVLPMLPPINNRSWLLTEDKTWWENLENVCTSKQQGCLLQSQNIDVGTSFKNPLTFLFPVLNKSTATKMIVHIWHARRQLHICKKSESFKKKNPYGFLGFLSVNNIFYRKYILIRKEFIVTSSIFFKPSRYLAFFNQSG